MKTFTYTFSLPVSHVATIANALQCDIDRVSQRMEFFSQRMQDVEDEDILSELKECYDHDREKVSVLKQFEYVLMHSGNYE